MMKLSPYCTAIDAADVERLLVNCRNYAPEQSEDEDSQCLVEYFRDAFVASADGGQAYVIRDADGLACSFVTVARHTAWNKSASLYVTGLYINKGNTDVSIAAKAICLLQECWGDSTHLYINVHPVHSEIISYWQEYGYCHQPNASDFTNCDNERLLAYEKNDT